MQKKNDDKKILRININLVVNMHFNIINVNGSFKN
jgi:hypothetical protein